jgi:hypothetical protein
VLQNARRGKGDMESSLTIDASTVEIQDTGHVLSVWLGELASEPPRYLSLQMETERTQQDITLGMAGVYAERDDQHWSGYKGVESIRLHRDYLEVVLNDNGRKDLMISGKIRVNFNLTDQDFCKVRSALSKICIEEVRFDDLA